MVQQTPVLGRGIASDAEKHTRKMCWIVEANFACDFAHRDFLILHEFLGRIESNPVHYFPVAGT